MFWYRYRNLYRRLQLPLSPVRCHCFTGETELLTNTPKSCAELLDEVKHEGRDQESKLELLN